MIKTEGHRQKEIERRERHIEMHREPKRGKETERGSESWQKNWGD